MEEGEVGWEVVENHQIKQEIIQNHDTSTGL